MFLFALVACNNIYEPGWSGGGTRYATGVARHSDTGTTDDTGTTSATGEGSPVLLTMSAVYSEPNEAEEVYIAVGVAYEDEAEDVSGGNAYYTLSANSSVLSEGSRGIVDEEADPNTEALIENENINFSIGPVDISMTHSLAVYVVDYNHNRSNEIEDDVTGE